MVVERRQSGLRRRRKVQGCSRIIATGKQHATAEQQRNPRPPPSDRNPTAAAQRSWPQAKEMVASRSPSRKRVAGKAAQRRQVDDLRLFRQARDRTGKLEPRRRLMPVMPQVDQEGKIGVVEASTTVVEAGTIIAAPR